MDWNKRSNLAVDKKGKEAGLVKGSDDEKQMKYEGEVYSVVAYVKTIIDPNFKKYIGVWFFFFSRKKQFLGILLNKKNIVHL